MTKYCVLAPGMKVKSPAGDCKSPALHNNLAASDFRLTKFHFSSKSGVIDEINKLGYTLDIQDKATELLFNYYHEVPTDEVEEPGFLSRFFSFIGISL